MALLEQILTALANFAAAGLATWALARWLAGRVDRHPDLVAEYRAEATGSSWPYRTGRLAVRLVARELPQSRLAGLRRRITENLGRAGAPAVLTPEAFLARALLEGCGIAVTVAVLMLALTGSPFVLLAGGLGLLHALGIRPHLLHAQAQERVLHIQRRLPYAMDLAVLVLRAGGTLREALTLAAERQGDPLAQEIALALTQMRTGTHPAKALTDMADRVRLEDLSTLVIGLNRGEEVGAPMAQTLETQAEIFRFRRMQRAERLAVEAPVKMMFPNMIIMLAVLLVVLGPIFVKLVNEGLF
jgi:tight adherence protein C